MIDMRRVRLEIFRRTRSHKLSCLVLGIRKVPGFRECKCDHGNKKQYLSDILVADMARGDYAELR
jgi:hypothetical protein